MRWFLPFAISLSLAACAHFNRDDCLRETPGSKRRPSLRLINGAIVGDTEYEATLAGVGSSLRDSERSRHAMELAWPVGVVGGALGASGISDAVHAGPRNPGAIAQLALGVPLVAASFALALASRVYRGRALDDTNDAARAVGRCPP